MNTQLLIFLIIISISAKFISSLYLAIVEYSFFNTQKHAILPSNYLKFNLLEERLSFSKIGRRNFIYRYNNCSHNGSNMINHAAVF